MEGPCRSAHRPRIVGTKVRAPAAERRRAPAFRLERAHVSILFHVHDGEDFPDLQGTELLDLNAARVEAVRFSSALLAEQPERFWNTGEWTLRVADEVGLTLFELTFIATDSPATSRAAPMAMGGGQDG